MRWDDDHEPGHTSSGQAILDISADEPFLSRFLKIKVLTAPNRGFGRFSRLVEHFEMCLKWQKIGFKWAKSAQYEANNDFSRALY